MILADCVQGEPSWHLARLGCVTASRVEKIITPTGKLSSSRHALLYGLVAEWLLGEPEENFQGGHWIERGVQNEPMAISFFEFQTDLSTKKVGFVYKDDAMLCGCSPDRLIGEPGKWTAGLEIKNPKASTHVGYLLSGGIPQEYVPQVQFSLWVTGLPAWWFCSFYPALPPVIVRAEPDPKMQAALDEHMPKFIAELVAAREKLREHRLPPKTKIENKEA